MAATGTRADAPVGRPSHASGFTPDQIIERMVERGAQTRAQVNRYEFLRLKVTEELDDENKVSGRRESLYRVRPVEGTPFARLIARNGTPLSGKDLEREEERERRFRANPKRESAKEADHEVLLTRSLVNRFEFEITGVDVLEGRAAWVLRFTPRDGLKEEKLEDRAIHRLAGTVWIDQAEFEVAKLEFGLEESFSVGWGLLGSLQQLKFTMERTRLPGGAWLSRSTHGEVHYRKLLEQRHFSWVERMSEFKSVSAAAGHPQGARG